MSDTPHLTPSKLLGPEPLPADWAAAQVAFICFTPFPQGFAPYVIATAPRRLFLHSPNSEVRLCQADGHSFLVISEVYGFAVGATTVEELVHYGIDQIIGVGYAGSFSGTALSQHFLAEATMADLPLAAHYGVPEMTACQASPGLRQLVEAALAEAGQAWAGCTVWNGNSLYREYEPTIAKMRAAGCDVVNMDTLSLYAVAPFCERETGRAIQALYVGTVTDAANDTAGDWESDLLSAVQGQTSHPHDRLVHFLVESVLPRISGSNLADTRK